MADEGLTIDERLIEIAHRKGWIAARDEKISKKIAHELFDLVQRNKEDQANIDMHELEIKKAGQSNG